MILALAIVLGVLWLLGILVIHISSPLLHLLILIAVVIFVYDLVTKRRAA